MKSDFSFFFSPPPPPLLLRCKQPGTKEGGIHKLKIVGEEKGKMTFLCTSCRPGVQLDVLQALSPLSHVVRSVLAVG